MARGQTGGMANSEITRDKRHSSGGSTSQAQNQTKDDLPTLTLTPHQDPRLNRPSLVFPPMTRVLPHEDCVIRVGRYSERDFNPEPVPNIPSAAPVGFKSKVVSRRHCEFWCSQGQWYIKDVKSSSGTFLNHIRLSQPSVESRPYPVNDGDVIQLGIDFRGGEEMIFRCVKIRVECNRGWQKTLNSYNVSTHKRLRDLGKTAMKRNSDAGSTHSSQECSICLMSIAPCQSLFVAPCSHVWHYKCIRPILNDHKVWPQFLCPNCRAITDLDADVDEPLDVTWDDEKSATHVVSENENRQSQIIPQDDEESFAETNDEGLDGLSAPLSQLLSIEEGAEHTDSDRQHAAGPISPNAANGILERRGELPVNLERMRIPATQIEFLRPISPTRPLMEEEQTDLTRSQTPVTDALAHEGPMTPTNTAGPFVFDGSAGQQASSDTQSLEAKSDQTPMVA